MTEDRDAVTPFLVEPGWIRAEFIEHPGGPTYRVLFYEDGSVRFEHRCTRRPDFTVIAAPALQLRSGGHEIEQENPLTVSPSIGCPDCGTHGFIREGRWVAA